MKGVFFDTNVWVYLLSSDKKGVIVQELQKQHDAELLISSQILGELYNVLTRKKLKAPVDAKDIVSRIASLYKTQPITDQDVLHAMDISNRYKLSYWDSLVVSSALRGGCGVLYTEDLQHGQTFEKKLKIINPFV